MVEAVAFLGGYLGRKTDGPPGAKAIWTGLQRAMHFAETWVLFGLETNQRCV
jgi:hypothetical protein